MLCNARCGMLLVLAFLAFAVTARKSSTCSEPSRCISAAAEPARSRLRPRQTSTGAETLTDPSTLPDSRSSCLFELSEGSYDVQLHMQLGTWTNALNIGFLQAITRLCDVKDGDVQLLEWKHDAERGSVDYRIQTKDVHCVQWGLECVRPGEAERVPCVRGGVR